MGWGVGRKGWVKIAILGGAFNPVHNGHLALAGTAADTYKIDSVIFVPTYIPPHKDMQEMASTEDRLAMVALAIEGNEKFESSRLEINRRNVSYSIDTVSYIKKIYPKNSELFFVIGSDAAGTLETWKNIDKILAMCKFIVGVRPNYTFETKYKTIEIMPMEGIDISSTRIRQFVREGRDIKNMVPEKVAEYIERFNLYR